LPNQYCCTVNVPADAAAGDRCKRFDQLRGALRGSIETRSNGFRHRVIGLRGETLRASVDISFTRLTLRQHFKPNQLGFAFRDGSSFVERDRFEIARFFEVRAALDQNAASRCCCETRSRR
jgi:hypothetical protein